MWNSVIVPNKNEHLTPFENNDYINCKYILENISTTNLTYGYDVCLKNGNDSKEMIFKTLKIILPELESDDIEEVLPMLDIKMGFYVDFPDIFDYSVNSAIVSSRGKISSRMIYALFYVYTIKQTIKVPGSILEIGAGTGRTAYYAYKMGFKKYTIVDIKSTGIVQAHYNFNILGEENVSLYGEEYKNQFLTLIPSDNFNEIKEKYDLVVNFDGLTEYGKEQAESYLEHSKELSDLFLSINHTFNEFTINQIAKNIKSSELCDYRLDIPNLIYFKELIILN